MFPGFISMIITRYLSKAGNQRIIYFLGLILWTMIWYFDDLESYPDKTFDMVWGIPSAFLIIQIIFNTFIVWTMIFALVTLYSVFLVTLAFCGIYRVFTLEGIIVLSIFFIASWIVYKIKPQPQENNASPAV
jgi:hypothetical protein